MTAAPTNRSNTKLFPVYCGRCKKQLCAARFGALVLCPSCKKWHRAGAPQNIPPEKLILLYGK